MKFEINKKPKLLNLTIDLVFTAFFRENTNLLKALLSDFLPFPEGSEIVEIALLDEKESSKEVASPQGKAFEFDLKVRLTRREVEQETKEETVIITLQKEVEQGFTDRLLANAMGLYSEQVEVGKDNNQLNPVYSLVFTTVNLKEFASLNSRHYHHCVMQSRDSANLVLTEDVQFVIVELDKFVKSLDKLLDQRDAWCYLFSKAEEMDEGDLEALKSKGEIMGEAVGKLWDLSQKELASEHA